MMRLERKVGYMTKKKMAPIWILIAGILWGCLGIFVRRLNALGLVSMEIVALRAIVTCIAMAVFLLFFDRKLFRIKIKDIWCFMGTGICSIVFFNFCYFKAITMTSLSIAAVLLYTAPAIVMVLSFFLFQEKFTKRKVISLVLTFVGCVLVTGVVTSAGNVTPFGLLVGLGAGLGYALYSIFGRYALERGYHSLTITFYTFLIAAVTSFFIADIPQIAEVATGSWKTFLFSAALGVLCTVVPYLTYTLGLKYVENSKASIIASVEPVTATLLGALLFHEKLTWDGVLGGLIVLSALFICRKEGSID